MKMIVEGVMDGNLPWVLIFTGVFIAIAIEIIGVQSMTFSLGLYLPIQTTTCIMIGGLIRLYMDKRKAIDEETKKKNKKQNENGILCCSGLIAGEGLLGIVLAIVGT